ncbi:PP2C family serine/threonine-protein phosphatase [Yoonia sp. 2307UL14-13]|uniref:PP2C family serine/threonine-protein phosphatase n=1 Tax=Yoonia sp. 2307UL14-13 TaxID=3126506 RepID=UPI00309C540C
MGELEGRLSRAATAGEYFVAKLVEPDGLTDLDVDWPDDVDLTFEQTKDGTWMLSGMVQTAKLHEFTLRGLIKGKKTTVNLRLPVSPDPWSMWKDLPVDWDTLPYPKEDTNSRRLVEDHVMIGASRRGRSHAHKGMPRDDELRIAFDAVSGWHFLLVADGAGSAAYSRRGSQIAVEQARAHLTTSLPNDPHDKVTLRQSMTDAMHAAAEGLDAFAQKNGHALNTLNTTLLVAIAKEIPGGWFLASMSVGDGLIGVVAQNQPPLMMTVDHGDFAGQTTFLRHDTIDPDRVHTRIVPDFTALIAMTDGVSDPMFTSQSAAADPAAWADLMARLESAGVHPHNPEAHSALLDWLNFRVKGEHDDRTIAILYPDRGTK